MNDICKLALLNDHNNSFKKWKNKKFYIKNRSSYKTLRFCFKKFYACRNTIQRPTPEFNEKSPCNAICIFNVLEGAGRFRGNRMEKKNTQSERWLIYVFIAKQYANGIHHHICYRYFERRCIMVRPESRCNGYRIKEMHVEKNTIRFIVLFFLKAKRIEIKKIGVKKWQKKNPHIFA